MQLHILHIEDSPHDAELIQAKIESEGIVCDIDCADSREAVLARLREFSYDLVLCDYSIPGYGGVAALVDVKAAQPDVPFIYVSGTIGEVRAVEVLKLGATDYVLKDDLTRLSSSIRRALREADERRMHTRAEAHLRESEMRFRLLFQNMLEGYAYCRMVYEVGQPHDFMYLDVNSAFETLTGLKNVVGKKVSEVIPGIKTSNPELFEIYGRVASSGKAESFETYVEPLGIWFSVSVYCPEIEHFISVFDNITERKLAEETVRESEARYHTLFEQSPDGIAVFDPETFRPIEFNERMCAQLGYTHEEFARLSISDYEIIDSPEQIQARAEKVTRDGQAVFDTKHRTKRGEIREVQVTVCSIMLRGKRVFYTIFHDIAERKRVEEEIKESQQRFRQITENIQEVFWLTDVRKNAMLYVSPAYESIWGRTCESLLTSPLSWVEAIHPDDRERIFDSAMKKQVIGEYDEEYRIVRPGGEIRWIHDKSFPIKNQDGEVFRIAGIAEDITARKNSEEQSRKSELRTREIEKQLIQLQKLDSIGTLASGIAHDFNNVLGIILAHTGVIERSKKRPPNEAKSLAAITKATRRGAELVRQILTFARKSDVVVESVRLNDEVEEAAKLLNETIAKQIEVRLELEPKLPTITADRTQIHQAIVNLAVNARDAMPHGGTLTISTATVSGSDVREIIPNGHADRYVVLKVRDTGTGMDGATKQRIFEPFFTTKEKGKGTGLGLAVVYGIVKGMGGSLYVETNLGVGTTFELYFPAPLNHVESSSDPKKESSKDLRGTEILLFIEDEESLANAMRDMLENYGYTVLLAYSGTEALEIYDQRWAEIALIVSDIGLPGISGPDVYQRMKTINPRLKTLLSTGFVEPAQRSELFKSGVKEIILKPYDQLELLEKIRQVLDLPG